MWSSNYFIVLVSETNEESVIDANNSTIEIDPYLAMLREYEDKLSAEVLVYI